MPLHLGLNILQAWRIVWVWLLRCLSWPPNKQLLQLLRLIPCLLLLLLRLLRRLLLLDCLLLMRLL